MCAYPKAPEHKIAEISKNNYLIYKIASKKFDCVNVTLIGDSAGGTLVIALTQRLIRNNICLPREIVLILPVLDASLQNIEIDEIDKKDLMLSRNGVLSAKQMCVDDGNLQQLSISPLNGSFEGFPPTYLFVAENDITYPDQILFHKN